MNSLVLSTAIVRIVRFWGGDAAENTGLELLERRQRKRGAAGVLAVLPAWSGRRWQAEVEFFKKIIQKNSMDLHLHFSVDKSYSEK